MCAHVNLRSCGLLWEAAVLAFRGQPNVQGSARWYAFLKLRIHRDGCFFAEHPEIPWKNMFIHQQFRYDSNPLKNHDLEFGVQPTAFHKILQLLQLLYVRSLSEWTVCCLALCVQTGAVPQSRWGWYAVQFDTESWCVCCVRWVKIALYILRSVCFISQIKE